MFEKSRLLPEPPPNPPILGDFDSEVPQFWGLSACGKQEKGAFPEHLILFKHPLNDLCSARSRKVHRISVKQSPLCSLNRMLTLTDRLPSNPETRVSLTLALTADERSRSRHRFDVSGDASDQAVYLCLPRGTVLHHGDLLKAESDGQIVRIIAKPEPVLTVTAQSALDLLRAAYHLGNRHVPLEVKATYLRLSPDPVLATMLEQLGLQVQAEVAPFQPEAGAYGNTHSPHRHEHHAH
jgi:urease accessory protein